MNPNKMTLDLTGNQDLREALASVGPGDSVTFEVEARLDENTGDQAQFTVQEATLIESEPMEAEGDGEEMEEGPESEAPEMVAGKGVAGKRGSAMAVLFGPPKNES